MSDVIVVTWTSSSLGYSKTKTGTVVALLDPGQSLAPYANAFPPSRVMVQRSTYVSSVARYVVVVRDKGKLPRLYAPRVAVVDRQNPHVARK